MNKLLRLVSALVILSFIAGCGNNNKLDVDVSSIETNIKLDRYEQAMFEIEIDKFVSEFPEVHRKYKNAFFAGQDIDSSDILTLALFRSDPKAIELYNDCQKVFTDLSVVESEINDVQKHYLYYYPEASTPKFYTYVNGLSPDYFESPLMIVGDSIVHIALDFYLGNNFKLYSELGVQKYLMNWMRSDQIALDYARNLMIRHLEADRSKQTLLDNMVNYGKALYFIDAMAPATADSLKIQYTSKQYDWMKSHEPNVWAYMVENQLLFSTENMQIQKFMQPGPYTPVFTEMSPPRIGQFMGWQIVKKYMENNADVSLQDLMMETDNQKILKGSNYKPAK